MSENIREIILDTLNTLETTDKKSHLLIRDVLDKFDYLDLRDKAFFKRVTEGTITNRITLDYVLNQYSKKQMDKCKPLIRSLLRMSAYQILFMDKVPDNAVCDEAVKLCRKRSFEEFCPFVNGVLRSVCKNKAECLDFSKIDDDILRLSIEYSVPEWMVRMFKKEQPEVESLLRAFKIIRPTAVRIKNSEDTKALLEAFDKAGITYSKSTIIDDAYLIDNFEGAELLPGFSEGKLIIQDESSMLVSLATGIKSGDDLTVIDTCAAPGGKTSAIASLMYPNGKVISCDVSLQKVSKIEENIERLALSNVKPLVQNALEYNENLFESADVLICDVPCSGLGVIGKKSDIRYNVTNESMKEICDLQKAIMKNVYRYLKPGGILIYSTCTIHKAENEKMVKFILENLPFEAESLKPYLPKMFEGEREAENYIQLRPDKDGTDGFFIARFRRKMD